LAQKFGWSVREASSIDELKQLRQENHVVAVLFDPHEVALPWWLGLRAVREAAPRAMPIVCSGFAHEVPWPELAARGAFHALHLPLATNEVRQSLGFVWAARQRAIA
jgi:hypothetical protein